MEDDSDPQLPAKIRAIASLVAQVALALASTAVLLLPVKTAWMAFLAFWPLALSLWLHGLCRNLRLSRFARLSLLSCTAITVVWFLLLLMVLPYLERT